MTYQIEVAGVRRFSAAEWRNAFSVYLQGIQDVNIVIEPEIKFLTKPGYQKTRFSNNRKNANGISLRLDTQQWFYYLECPLNFRFIKEPRPAFIRRIEIVANQQSDVEFALADFIETTIVQMLILLLPPKKMFLWKSNETDLFFQVDDMSPYDFKSFKELV
jgi:hypothetical protein